MTNVQNFNKEFGRIVKSIRWFMPYLAIALLLAVYAVSAWAEGYMLSHLFDNARLAYCIGVVIQFTRGTLVFFPQLNPMRPVISLRGELIAIGMGLLAVGSIVGLVEAAGLAIPVAVSLSILMLAGVGVEIFLLKEIKFISHMELFRNRQWWQEIQEYYLAERKLASFMDKLRDYADGDIDTLTIPGIQVLPPPLELPASAGTELPAPATTPPAGGDPLSGMKLRDIYNLVKDQGVSMMDLADMSMDQIRDLVAKSGKLSPAEPAVATQEDEYPDEMQRDRYLRAARNNLRSALELESKNQHEEAKKDYDLADEYIRLAYPSAHDQYIQKTRDQILADLHIVNSFKDVVPEQSTPRRPHMNGAGSPLDLTGNGRIYQ